MSLPTSPSEPPDQSQRGDRIPLGSFNAPQTLDEFMGLLEAKTLEYVNEICSNVILDIGEKKGVHQSRLRKFVVHGNSTMRNPERTFCIPSLVDRKKAAGWDIRRILHYIELAALTGQVPTDEKNQYHAGYENQLGIYLVKAQYYQQKETVAEYDELWRNGGHVYENIALQIACLETDVLPDGYSIALATAEEDAYQKIDFFLKNNNTEEKIGVQFTISRTRVEGKVKDVRESRKDLSQTAAILSVTPGGIHRNISDLMMPDYKHKQDILFAERMKRHFPDNYSIFCNQLKQAFARIVSSQDVDDVVNGIIVRIVPGTPAAIPVAIEAGPESIETDKPKKEHLPDHMQTKNGFERAWREFLAHANTSFTLLLDAQPTTESNKADILHDWAQTKFTYNPDENLETSIILFLAAINDFIQGGDSKEYKQRRVRNFRDFIKDILGDKGAKTLLPVNNFSISSRDLLQCYSDLPESELSQPKKANQNAEKMTLIQQEVDILSEFFKTPSVEALESVGKSVRTLVKTALSITTPDNRDVVQQQIEQHLNEADIETALSDPHLISYLISEINTLLSLVYTGTDVTPPTIDIPVTFDAATLVPHIVSQVSSALNTTLPAGTEPVKTDPKIKLQEKIESTSALILSIQSRIDELSRGVAGVTSELGIFENEKVRLSREISAIDSQITEGRDRFAQSIPAHVAGNIHSSDFYTNFGKLLQTAQNKDNELSAARKKLEQKLSECEQSIIRGQKRLAEAEKNKQTEEGRLLGEKQIAEKEQEKYLSALQVLRELD